VDLATHILQLEEAAPLLYARWSPRAWRIACEGPAAQLWQSLQGDPAAAPTLASYLSLLREAVGLQYLALSQPGDLTAPARSFLTEALCHLLPRLLAPAAPEVRAAALAQVWNAGERLESLPPWLGRYLAVRLRGLESLAALEASLAAAIHEGFDEVPPAAWEGPYRVTVLDAGDWLFLPGRIHFATASLACVHDRRRAGKQLAVLARRGTPPLLLGPTPCLGEDRPPFAATTLAPGRIPGLPEQGELAAVAGGCALLGSPLSQRLWVLEAAR
jgi:hypothetical protein